MTSLLLFLLLAAGAGSEVSADCDGEEGALRVRFWGLEAEVAGESFLVRRPSSLRAELATQVAARAVAGEDGAGLAYELSLDQSWSLRRGDAAVPLAIPRSFERPEQAQVMGQSREHVWLAAPDLLGCVDVRSAVVTAARVGRRAQLPLLLEAQDGVALIVSGQEVVRCSASGGCERAGSLTFLPEKVAAGPGGWLFAAGGSTPGLYRAPSGVPLSASLLAEGRVLALCRNRQGEAWAALLRGVELRLVTASTATPAARPFTPAEVVVRAVTGGPMQEADLLLELLARARAESWSQLQALALHALEDERPAVRAASAAALGDLKGARVGAGLWLLSHDADVSVRMASLQASAARCRAERQGLCPYLVTPFLADPDPEISSTARDLMLAYDPERALEGAPTAYKLEAISTLIGLLERSAGFRAQRALELLADDRDDQVRSAARLALGAMVP